MKRVEGAYDARREGPAADAGDSALSCKVGMMEGSFSQGYWGPHRLPGLHSTSLLGTARG